MMSAYRVNEALIAVTLFFAAHGAFAAKPASAASGASAASAADTTDASEAEVEIDDASPKDGVDAAKQTAARSDFCFFSGKPPSTVKYTVVRKLKLGKGTYGGVKDVLPKFAANAQRLGADAIIEYAGSQRFGFWPWRLVRPVVHGVAVKWVDPQSGNCQALGGSTLQTILATDQAPAK